MEQVFATAKDKMNKSVNALMEELATIRVGRASARRVGQGYGGLLWSPHPCQSNGGGVGAGTPHPVDHPLGQNYAESH